MAESKGIKLPNVDSKFWKDLPKTLILVKGCLEGLPDYEQAWLGYPTFNRTKTSTATWGELFARCTEGTLVLTSWSNGKALITLKYPC
jgi:hypothetical protein